LADLEGKVALVTGGSSGIGRSTALAFARAGAKVAVADVAVEGGEETARMIREIGGEAIFVLTDVTQSHQVEALVRKTVDTYGRLDCAFNNAGIEGAVTSTTQCSEENWHRVMAINLTGVWLCMKHEIVQMQKQGGGAIVNTSSISGLTGLGSNPAYVSSKHGVIGLTRLAAVEYAKQGIRVNAVCPAAIATPMVKGLVDAHPDMEQFVSGMQPMGRLGTPEEVAQVVVWLCSDSASFVTGQALPVDGGMVAQ